jgi:hypothetical protein
MGKKKLQRRSVPVRGAMREAPRAPLLPPPSAPVVEAISTLDSTLGELRRAVNRRDALERSIHRSVLRARSSGATWTAIARVLGVSPQAVQKRWGRS